MDLQNLYLLAYNLVVTHIPSRRLRKIVLKRMLGELADDVFVGMHTTVFRPSQVFIGERSVINQHCILDGRGGTLTIREDVDVGAHTHIWTLEHDPHDDNHGTKGGNVEIEDHVWIATRVTVLPGIHIERGAVVSAGAVVAKDVSPRTIVGGVPAKQIGIRMNSLLYSLKHSPKFR